MTVGEYARTGVGYRNMQPFKDLMVEMGRLTLGFPNKRDVYVQEGLSHSLFQFMREIGVSLEDCLRAFN